MTKNGLINVFFFLSLSFLYSHFINMESCASGHVSSLLEHLPVLNQQFFQSCRDGSSWVEPVLSR